MITNLVLPKKKKNLGFGPSKAFIKLKRRPILDNRPISKYGLVLDVEMNSVSKPNNDNL